MLKGNRNCKGRDEKMIKYTPCCKKKGKIKAFIKWTVISTAIMIMCFILLVLFVAWFTAGSPLRPDIGNF